MRRSVRAAGLSCCAVLSAITLAASAVVPVGGPDAPPARDGGAELSAPEANDQATTSLAGTAGQADAARAVRELAGSDAKAPVVGRDRNGRLLSVTAQPGTTLELPEGADGPDEFVQRYGTAFGVTSDYSLERTTVLGLPGGDSAIRYQQQAGGVPLIGGQLVVTVDPSGGVRGTIGETSSTRPTATAAKVDAGTAAGTALAEAARKAGVGSETLEVSGNELWLYDPRVIGAPGRAEVRPTWWVSVSEKDGGEMASVLVDALDGSVRLAISERREARDRIVCDLANQPVNLNDRSQYACNFYSPLGQKSTTRREGGASSTVAEVNRAFAYLGASYDFFRSRYGRDSYDGRGAEIQATVRACHVGYTCPFPNAFWEGKQLVFGQGFVTDDVVAHEFTHAVTEYSSDLFYAYESGALNEAISDIMAEFIDRSYNPSGEDLTKVWLAGEDLPMGAIRDMKDPNRYYQPARVGDTYWSKLPPTDPNFDNGGVHTNSGPANRLAYLIADGATIDWSTTIRGIGMAKSEKLWYRTAHLLPSGADYNTLGAAIFSTCLQMVGFHGFVWDDCRQVETAVHAIGTWTRNVESPCGGSGTEDRPVFVDDLEGRDKWTLTGSVWQYLPSPEIPVRWATSGTTALYGYGDGTTGYATMKSSVTIPSADIYGGPFLSFQANDPNAGGRQVTRPAVQYNSGAGWQTLSGGYAYDMFGYKLLGVPLSSLQGKTVKFRIGLNANHQGHEWLVDDIKVFSCSVMDPSARYASAIRTGSSAEITWVYDSWLSDHIELSYNPPLPGAPTRLDGIGEIRNDYVRSLTVTGLDPDTTYTVSIVIVDDQNNTRSRPVSVTLATGLPAICPTRPPLSFTLSWALRKPAVGADECGNMTPVPRR